MHIPTCRFCDKRIVSSEGGVKYSTRHYAHFDCYLDAGKKLASLPAWKVGEFPWKLLRDRGLETEAAEIMDAHDAAV